MNVLGTNQNDLNVNQKRDSTLGETRMSLFSENFKTTLFLRAYTFAKIPLIWWIRPSVVELSKERTVIQIKLRRKTKNHLNSMYFGALAIGAELVVALRAVKAIYNTKKKVDFVFKDFHIEFLKRAEGHVHFICDAGSEVQNLVLKTIESGERETQTFSGFAIVPSQSSTEPVIQFKVTLSVKHRKKV